MTEEKKYKPGDHVKIDQGHYEGRTGRFMKYNSVVFKEYCKVKLDLKGCQRVHEEIMVEHKYLSMLPDEQQT